MLGEKPDNVLPDGGKAAGFVLAGLEERGITAFAPAMSQNVERLLNLSKANNLPPDEALQVRVRVLKIRANFRDASPGRAGHKLSCDILNTLDQQPPEGQADLQNRKHLCKSVRNSEGLMRSHAHPGKREQRERLLAERQEAPLG